VSLINLKHIACVVDFNEESRLALSVAGTMALHSSAELCAIHIIERLVAFGNIMMSGQPTYHTGFFDYANDESSQRALLDMMKHSLPQGISLIPYIVYGSRIQNVVDILWKCQADLCVIGLRNKTEWWENILSPYWIQQIMRLAPCPVLSIPK
jgi:nucleotide-binding universal stress UspA family protein